MRKHALPYLILILLCAACQGQAPADSAVELVFPTMTPGQTLRGWLPTPGFSTVGNVDSPATAIALASRATDTPVLDRCPLPDADRTLGNLPNDRSELNDLILDFLNGGGTPDSLEEALTEASLMGEGAYLRADADLTGEGTPEIVLGFTAPGDVGTMLIYLCSNGRYSAAYEATSDAVEAPALIWLGDMNRDFVDNLVFASRVCRAAADCEYETRILGWDTRRGRFVNLIEENLSSISLPAVSDMDNDEVIELIVNLTSNGTSTTGPLRTGVNIYDWNGAVYALSIIQLNPPRYRIQVVHQADRDFLSQRIGEAIALYELALNDETLRYWFDDGSVTVDSYVLYRLVLAYAYAGDERIVDVLLRLAADFPDSEENPAPVYARMARTFINTLEITQDLHSACIEVQAIIEQDPSALSLMNRYGSRNPQYTALELCPF